MRSVEYYDSLKTVVDFTFADHGSITILNALTPASIAWIDEHLPEDTPNSAVIEPRYAGPILEGIINDGLTVNLE